MPRLENPMVRLIKGYKWHPGLLCSHAINNQYATWCKKHEAQILCLPLPTATLHLPVDGSGFISGTCRPSWWSAGAAPWGPAVSGRVWDLRRFAKPNEDLKSGDSFCQTWIMKKSHKLGRHDTCVQRLKGAKSLQEFVGLCPKKWGL